MSTVMTQPLKLGNKLVGDGHPIYIMADVGLTNGGDIVRTKELIDIAAEYGVDAMKFQMIGPEVLLGDKTVEYTYPTIKNGKRTENMFEMFSKLNYTEDQWAEIAEYTRKRGLEFICTAHYSGAVPLLEKLNVSIHKICTWSSSHKRLIQSIGKTGKALMLDTGMVSTFSLMQLLSWHQEAGGKGAFILHDFHTKDPEQMNFLSIPYIKETFGFPVGYTPQGRNFETDFMSIGLGVNILEKRLTTDINIPENGHFKALEPEEFKQWIEKIKFLEKSLGHKYIQPTKDDIEQSKRYYKSLYAKVDIAENDLITEEVIESRRPGTGITSSEIDSFIGKRATKSIKAGTMFTVEDFK